VTAGGHKRPGVHGEHSWAWENLLFGGCTVLYQDAIGNKQAGVPYAYIVQTDQNNNIQKVYYKYKDGYVQSVANFSKSKQYSITFSNHTF
jgi:hypothetical protein